MKPEYARTTITVPWKLKKQMKRDGGQTNWSAVACEAFEAKLEELGPVKELTSIDDVVARMKSTADANQGNREAALADGLAAGKHWAMNSALPDQLKRIQEFRSKIQEDVEEGDIGWEQVMSKPHGRHRLAKCILKGHPQPRVEFADAFDGGWQRPGWQQGRHRGPQGGRRRGGPGHGPGGRPGRGGGRGRQGGPPRHPSEDGPSGQAIAGDRLQRWRQESAQQARMVWRSLLNERPSDPIFFLGFANGALEVWEEVKTKLG